MLPTDSDPLSPANDSAEHDDEIKHAQTVEEDAIDRDTGGVGLEDWLITCARWTAAASST